MVPIHARPECPTDSPEAERLATRLRSRLVDLSRRAPVVARAYSHAVWALALRADRRYRNGRWEGQVAHDYIKRGAGLGGKAARKAVTLLRSDLGISEPNRRGWHPLSAVRLEALWRAVGWADQHGFLDRAPAVARSELVFAFHLRGCRGRSVGKARCGCGRHAHDDADPSLLFDEARGNATCLVTRATFILRRDGRRLAAYTVRWVKPDGSEVPVQGPKDRGYTNTTGGGGGGTGDGHKAETLRQAQDAGRPGYWPPRPGLVNVTVCGPEGRFRPSQARSRSSWALHQWRRRRTEVTERSVNGLCAEAQVSGQPEREVCPDWYVGVGHWGIVRAGGLSDGRYLQPEVRELGTAYVLLDIDDTQALLLPDSKWRPLVAGVVEGLAGFRGLIDRVEWMVKTSTRGVQVLCRLQAFRRDVRAFYRSPAVRDVLRAAGTAVTALLGSGEVDEAVWRVNSLARVPGWRSSEFGATPARLLFTAEAGFIPWS